MKIIFLDIDGVLINYASLLSGNSACRRCVAYLNQITDATGAKIVVSSTWRKGGLVSISNQLKAWGVRGDVVGVTPDLDRLENGIVISPSRGEEIKAYLEDHLEICNFVILDDESDMGNLLPHLIKTEYETGLDYTSYHKALEAFSVSAKVKSPLANPVSHSPQTEPYCKKPIG
jgi:hypothetical protein